MYRSLSLTSAPAARAAAHAATPSLGERHRRDVAAACSGDGKTAEPASQPQ